MIESDNRGDAPPDDHNGLRLVGTTPPLGNDFFESAMVQTDGDYGHIVDLIHGRASERVYLPKYLRYAEWTYQPDAETAAELLARIQEILGAE